MENSERKIFESVVAVIGGAGFLGSHLVNHLIEDRKCTVLVLDNLTTGQRKFINPKAKFLWYDITSSEDNLRQVFEENGVEFVFNYAAEPYIPVSFRRPLHVFNVNAFAAMKVMNAAQEAGVKGILQVSSAEIYGGGLGIAENIEAKLADRNDKISEDEFVFPHSSYGVSKMAVDAFVQVRWKEAKTPAIAMRQFNCLGERETHPYIVPEIISQVAHGTRADVSVNLGNNSFRDFQYAGDAVRMAVELLEKGKFGEVYNMGSESGIKMYELAKVIGDLMGKRVFVFEDPARKRPWEIWHLQSDNTKLYSAIEARPKVGLTEGLQRTINYFHENGDKWDF